MPDPPIAMNIEARNGRQAGVRNVGIVDTIAQPRPKMEILWVRLLIA